MGTLGGEMNARRSFRGLGGRVERTLSDELRLEALRNDGSPAADLPLVEWNYRSALYTIQAARRSLKQSPRAPRGVVGCAWPRFRWDAIVVRRPTSSRIVRLSLFSLHRRRASA